MTLFERYLTIWVALCMVIGVCIGKLFPGFTSIVRQLEFGTNSHINIPIAILIWLMIYPMMMKIDFRSILNVGKQPEGLWVTLAVNWLIKPFSMALLGYFFFKRLFLPMLGMELANQYLAGVIILAAAPCTAMVFVWSYLTNGNPAYTLVTIFAFQADNLIIRWFHVVLIAIPLLIQVYFNSSLTYLLMRWLKVPHNIAAPGALIGASNFFELAVATAIALYGPGSGAALATVVGVLVEVPVMLSVCGVCNRTKGWYEKTLTADVRR